MVERECSGLFKGLEISPLGVILVIYKKVLELGLSVGMFRCPS